MTFYLSGTQFEFRFEGISILVLVWAELDLSVCLNETQLEFHFLCLGLSGSRFESWYEWFLVWVKLDHKFQIGWSSAWVKFDFSGTLIEFLIEWNATYLTLFLWNMCFSLSEVWIEITFFSIDFNLSEFRH